MKASERGAAQVKLGQDIQSINLPFLVVCLYQREEFRALPPSFLKEWAAFPLRDLKEVSYLNRLNGDWHL